MFLRKKGISSHLSVRYQRKSLVENKESPPGSWPALFSREAFLGHGGEMVRGHSKRLEMTGRTTSEGYVVPTGNIRRKEGLHAASGRGVRE